MKKTFESFINSQTLELEKIQKLMNENKNLFPVVNNFINRLPKSWKDKLLDYFQNETIDVDKILSFNKRFKIFEKTVKLYRNGVKNVQEIYDNIIPKNESVFITVIGVILVVLGIMAGILGIVIIFASLEEGWGRSSFFLLIIAIIISVFGIWGGNKLMKYSKNQKSEYQEIKFDIKKENRKRTIVVNIDENGNYTLTEEESNW